LPLSNRSAPPPLALTHATCLSRQNLPMVETPRAPVVWGNPNPLSALTFYYVTPLVQSGYRSRLEKEDLCYSDDQKIDKARSVQRRTSCESYREG
jgi:hypothetical protein